MSVVSCDNHGCDNHWCLLLLQTTWPKMNEESVVFSVFLVITDVFGVWSVHRLRDQVFVQSTDYITKYLFCPQTTWPTCTESGLERPRQDLKTNCRTRASFSPCQNQVSVSFLERKLGSHAHNYCPQLLFLFDIFGWFTARKGHRWPFLNKAVSVSWKWSFLESLSALDFVLVTTFH